MKEIKNLMLQFIDYEKKAEEAYRKGDIESHNAFANKITELTGLALIQEIKLPLSESDENKIARYKDIPVSPRYLFKISEYKNDVFGSMWVAYVSVANPVEGEAKLLSSYFAIAYDSGQLKMVARFHMDSDTYQWRFTKGDRSVAAVKENDFIATERYTSPALEEWSVSEYLKDS